MSQATASLPGASALPTPAPARPPVLAPGTAVQVMHYRGVVLRAFLTIRTYLGRGRYATVPLRSPLYLVRLDLTQLYPYIRHTVQVHIPPEVRGQYLAAVGTGLRRQVADAHPAYEMRVFGDELACLRPRRGRGQRRAAARRAAAAKPGAQPRLRELRQELAARLC